MEINSKAPLARCSECPLSRAACAKSISPNDSGNTRGVMPQRPGAAYVSSASKEHRVAIVSRSPGFHDTRANRPFAGPSGKLLEYLLDQHGVQLRDCYVSNIVLCQTENPPQQAIDCCSDRLDKELSDFAPTIIIAAGAEAAKRLLKKRGKIDNLRGVVHESAYGPVVVTNNPAAALRNADIFPNLLSDFRKAFDPPIEFIPPTVHYTEKLEDVPVFLNNILETVGNDGIVAADIEATGLRYGSRLLCIGFASSIDTAYVIGRDVLDGPRDVKEKAYEMLDDFFALPKLRFSWHNGQYDTEICRSWGIGADVDHDTQLLHYSLDERSKLEYHSLDYCLQDLLGWPDYTPEKIKFGKKNGFVNILPDEWPEVYQYNGFDTVGVRRLIDYLIPRVENE